MTRNDLLRESAGIYKKSYILFALYKIKTYLCNNKFVIL